MVKSKHEFLLWFKFEFKMIHALTFLCLTTFIVNPTGEVINSEEFEQFGSDEEIWFQIKKIEKNNRNCGNDASDSECDGEKHQSVLLLATQIAISAALVVGIITILILFWKICKSTNRRPQRRRRRARRNNRQSVQSEESIDSIQQVVIERLRDAPPNYIRAVLLPAGDTPPPYNLIASAHNNPGFDPDYNTPPPSYSAALEQENSTTENNRRSSNKSNDEIRVDLPKESDDTPDATLHI